MLTLTRIKEDEIILFYTDGITNPMACFQAGLCPMVLAHKVGSLRVYRVDAI